MNDSVRLKIVRRQVIPKAFIPLWDARLTISDKIILINRRLFILIITMALIYCIYVSYIYLIFLYVILFIFFV